MDGAILSSDCLERYGLTQQPFLPQWQDAFAFGDTSLDMPLNVSLEHLRDESPPLLIKGEYGIGKSAQLQRLMARGQDLHFCLIEAGPDTSMAAVDYAVRLQWQPHPRHGEPKQLSLDRYLAALCEDGMRPVLLIDDAHHLEPKVLGTLLNLKQHMINKLGQTLGLVLTGERSIDQTLALLEGKLRIVGDLYAITARPLNREQTAQYIAHRLQAAGLTGAMPLDDATLDDIQQRTGGLPGAINPLAIEALQAGCTDNKGKTNGTRQRASGNGLIPGRLLMPAAVVLVVLGLLASLYGLIVGLLDSGEENGLAVSESRQLPAAPSLSTEEQTEEEAAPTAATEPPVPETPAPPAPVDTVAQAPEEAVPRADTPSPTAPATAEPEGGTKPFFDFSADFSESEMPADEAPEPEPATRPEPQPEPPPAPVAAAPTPQTIATPASPVLPEGPLHDSLWLMRQDPDHYTIQALGVSSERAARGFYAREADGLEAALADTRRAGRDWYVLVIGLFPTAAEARDAIPALPGAIQKNQPFIRRLGDLQEAILEAR